MWYMLWARTEENAHFGGADNVALESSPEMRACGWYAEMATTTEMPSAGA